MEMELEQVKSLSVDEMVAHINKCRRASNQKLIKDILNVLYKTGSRKLANAMLPLVVMRTHELCGTIADETLLLDDGSGEMMRVFADFAQTFAYMIIGLAAHPDKKAVTMECAKDTKLEKEELLKEFDEIIRRGEEEEGTASKSEENA